MHLDAEISDALDSDQTQLLAFPGETTAAAAAAADKISINDGR